MTGREKIETALGPEGSPSFAAVTCYQGIFLRDHWEQATDAPWWVLHDPRPEVAAKPWLDMLRRTDEDWFPVHYGYSRRMREELVIEAAGDQVWLVNRRTGQRQALHRPPISGEQPDADSRQEPPGAHVQSEEELEAALDATYGPRPGPFTPPAAGASDYPDLLLRELGQDRMPISHVGAPWWLCHSLWGFTGLMERMVTTPELVRRACERLLEHATHQVQYAAGAGARLVWIEDCMSDMISPRQCRDFSLAYVRPLVEAIHEAGMLAVHYYCGRPDDRWDYLLDTGADALALEEGKKGFDVDIMQVADMVRGRMALLGNIDAIAVLQNGSDAALRAEVARQIAAGRRNRNRFVVSLGSPVTPGTPLARVRQYCDLVHELA